MRVEAHVELPIPPEDAWRRILVWEDQPHWMKDAAAVTVLTPNREGVGVVVAVRTCIFGFLPLFTDRLEVTLWDPSRRLVMAHHGFVRGVGEWTLEPADGATRFTWMEQLRLAVPVLGEAALWIYRPIMRRLMRRSLANLAALLRDGS